MKNNLGIKNPSGKRSEMLLKTLRPDGLHPIKTYMKKLIHLINNRVVQMV